MSKHPFCGSCDCRRCVKEAGRRAAQSAAAPRPVVDRAAAARRARWACEGRRGYLGSDESMDAYLSGRPMSSDDY